MNICPICSPVISINVPHTSNRCENHSKPSWQGQGVINPDPAPGVVIPSYLIKIEDKLNKDMSEALPKIIKQVVDETRKQIAKEIEDRICDVVHNKTSPESCQMMNNGFRIAAFIARGYE